MKATGAIPIKLKDFPTHSTINPLTLLLTPTTNICWLFRLQSTLLAPVRLVLLITLKGIAGQPSGISDQRLKGTTLPFTLKTLVNITVFLPLLIQPMEAGQALSQQLICLQDFIITSKYQNNRNCIYSILTK